MRFPPIEHRSRRYAARQYVSDSHDDRESPRRVFVQTREEYEHEVREIERVNALFDGKSFHGLKAAWTAKHGRR
jgi:hypothetical protein